MVRTRFIERGQKSRWLKIKTACKTHLTGKTEKLKQYKEPKIEISDGFTIGGFKTDRTNDFEEGMSELN